MKIPSICNKTKTPMYNNNLTPNFPIHERWVTIQVKQATIIFSIYFQNEHFYEEISTPLIKKRLITDKVIYKY